MNKQLDFEIELDTEDVIANVQATFEFFDMRVDNAESNEERILFEGAKIGVQKTLQALGLAIEGVMDNE